MTWTIDIGGFIGLLWGKMDEITCSDPSIARVIALHLQGTPIWACLTCLTCLIYWNYLICLTFWIVWSYWSQLTARIVPSRCSSSPQHAVLPHSPRSIPDYCPISLPLQTNPQSEDGSLPQVGSYSVPQPLPKRGVPRRTPVSSSAH